MSNHPDRIEIDLVPLALFSQRLAEGWRMVPGYPLQPDDYCVTMMPPRYRKPRSNLGCATAHRNKVTAEKRRARQEAFYALKMAESSA